MPPNHVQQLKLQINIALHVNGALRSVHFLDSQPLSSNGSICLLEYISLKSEPNKDRSPSSRMTP